MLKFTKIIKHVMTIGLLLLNENKYTAPSLKVARSAQAITITSQQKEKNACIKMEATAKDPSNQI